MEKSRGVRRSDRVAIAVLALAVVTLTWSGFVGWLPSVRDMPGATIPSRWFWRESILGGHIPAWNPYVSLGFPTIASPVHGSLYPLHVLLAVLPFQAGFFGTWALHAFLGGVGGYVLARSCGCRSESALVSGLVWAVGGYATSMWWNGEKLLPTAWIPWVAWGLRRVSLAPRVFGAELPVAAACGAMLCAAGDPFLLFDAAVLGFFAAQVALPGASAPGIGRLLASVGLVFGLAVMLAGPVLLPAALLSSETSRGSALTLHDAELWSMHPVRWLELFVPAPLGDPLAPAASYAGRTYADAVAQVHPWAVSLFVGSATLALATAARGRRVLLPLWSAATLAVLLALGRHTPVDAWARRLVPGLALARYPEKHAVVACAAVALLASRGLEELLLGKTAARRALLVALGGLAVAVALAPAALRETTRHGMVHAALVIAVLGGVLVAARRYPRLAWAIPLIVSVDLVTSSRALLDWMRPSELAPPPIAVDLATRPGESPRRILRLPSVDFRRVSTLPDNASSLFGVAALPGWDPAVSPLVDAVLVPKDPDDPATEWTVTRAPERSRAWMVGRVIAAKNDAEAMKALAAPELDLESAALVVAAEMSPDANVLASGPSRALGACDAVDYQADHVHLRCKADAPALLVMADTAMRGWQTTLDGFPAPTLRVNVAMRGVVLSPGVHEVTMRFEPPGLVEGLWVATLAALVSALAIARGRAETLAS
jgi:hypothetical protein